MKVKLSFCDLVMTLPRLGLSGTDRLLVKNISCVVCVKRVPHPDSGAVTNTWVAL